MTSCSDLVHQSPSEKGSTQKDNLLRGQILSAEISPFSQRRKTNLTELAQLKCANAT